MRHFQSSNGRNGASFAVSSEHHTFIRIVTAFGTFSYGFLDFVARRGIVGLGKSDARATAIAQRSVGTVDPAQANLFSAKVLSVPVGPRQTATTIVDKAVAILFGDNSFP